MVLSNRRVLQAMDEGRVEIHPFRAENLATSSYDVCLGEWFYREQQPRFAGDIFNPYDPEHVARVWGEPERAQPAPDATYRGRRLDLKNIEDTDRVILLRPGETILAHTEEFIGGRENVTTMMKARSSTGRCFVGVCKCAGWGDVGYVNRWTMEITNFSQHYSVPLVVGSRVAQIVFMETGTADGSYADRGAYQRERDVEVLRQSWHPSSMLPKMRR